MEKNLLPAPIWSLSVYHYNYCKYLLPHDVHLHLYFRPMPLEPSATPVCTPAMRIRSICVQLQRLGVQLSSKIRLFPDHWGRKSSHYCMSSLASMVILILWCRRTTVVLRSIILLRKILPAGTTLHANENFLISESSSLLVHFLGILSCSDCNSSNGAGFLSMMMLASMVRVFK